VLVVKGVSLPTRFANTVRRVVEPELDMDRFRRTPFSGVTMLRHLMQKLIPTRQWTVHSPMRSIARELEEVWPSSEL
jgi:hypothetical protein